MQIQVLILLPHLQQQMNSSVALTQPFQKLQSKKMIIQFQEAQLHYKKHPTFTHQEVAERLLALVQAQFSRALEQAVAAAAVELALQALVQAQQ